MDPAAASATASAGQAHQPNSAHELPSRFAMAVQQLKEAYAVLLQRISDKAQQRTASEEQGESEAIDRSLQIACEQFFAHCDEIEIICVSKWCRKAFALSALRAVL